MRLRYNVLKIIAIFFGIFTFCWMLHDFFSNKKIINQNYTKANHAFLDKKYDKAYDYYERALNQDPDNIYYLEGKARALFKMGSIGEAERIFKIVIKFDEEFVAAIANLGILYDSIGEYKKAIKYYKLAVSKESKVTDGISWFKRFLKNIHFKPSSIKDRLTFLENQLNSEKNNLNLRNIEIDEKQPDFEM